MSKTYEKQLGPRPEYKKAEIGEADNIVSDTNRIGPSPRSIATSCTEGTIKVIIVNKPQPTKSVDKSTS